jgi:hypothetical protein
MKITNIWITTALITVVLLACSCKAVEKIKIVEGEKVIEYRDRVRVDSILSTIKDSIYISGDTVKIYRDRYHDRLVLRTDTIIKWRKKAVMVETVKVEPVSSWVYIKIGLICLLIGLAIGYLSRYWVKVMTLF